MPTDADLGLGRAGHSDAGSDGEASAPDPSLVGWWRFEEPSGSTMATDSSGYGNHGVASGGVTRVPGPTGFGSAAQFDGTTGYIQVSDSTSLALGTSFTVAAWVHLDMVPHDQTFIFARSTVWRVKLNSRYPQLAVLGGFDELTQDVAPDVWHHVAFTFEAGSATGYVDGVMTTPQAGSPFGTGSVGASGGIIFGMENGGGAPDNFTQGALDEIRIYDRALAPNEVAALATP